MAVITGGAIAYLIFFMQTRLARAAINGKLLGNWLSSCSPPKNGVATNLITKRYDFSLHS